MAGPESTRSLTGRIWPAVASAGARGGRAGDDQLFTPRVKAILGPTNTGKTHLAIERLLAHSSGIIGFPLRLLARENYDRMVARKGARHVALITGEEKIIPPEARWFSCTVEAMPLDRAAEFVAVDEIQLCADPDRGHVFTDRLLHARGMVETMFLGAETVRRLLQRLVPAAEIETRPRLSQISYAGVAKLTRLPPRSAVVAFSAGEVYAIAEWLRRRRGGCAVVMGRLSPRTRNAQVALYQDKEVDFLVATDAIGMGLNMDVNHVAFASLTKFDGHRPRPLQAAELAQIAGRAGRGLRDGSFGTTGTCPPIREEIVQAVENHRFDPLEQLCWRNSALDFSGIDALLASLLQAPTVPGLVRGNDASDLDTLAVLSRDPELRALSRGARALRVLWEACQIPDFRKLADDSHARLCARVFGHVVRDGGLPDDWLAASFDGLGRTEGDLDTLMARLAGVRVWSYIAARADWVRDAAHWQARARAIEDSISDVLHERLTARFVDRRAAHLMRRLDAGSTEILLSAVTRRGEVVVEGHSVGRLDGFVFVPDPLAEGDARKLVLRAARRALREEMPRRVAALAAADDAGFSFDPAGRLAWDGAPVARLRPGPGLLRPHVEVLDSEFLDGAQRERVRQRLQSWLDLQVRTELAPLFTAGAAAQAEPGLRGLLHRLTEAAGVCPHADREGQGGFDCAEGEAMLAPEPRARLRALGVRLGRFALFLPALLKPRAAAMRARLWSIREGVPIPPLAPAAAVALPATTEWPEGFGPALGWVAAGPVLVRLDIAERLAAELAYLTRRGAAAMPLNLASRLAVGRELVPAVLRGLGFRSIPAGVPDATAYGPPAPAMIVRLRGGHPRPAAAAARRDRPASLPRPLPGGPFAALAGWQPVAVRGRAGRQAR